VASEIAAVIGREAFGYLDMPIEMVCGPFVPVPFSPVLEDFIIPKEPQLISAIRRVLNREVAA
jgi:pyruvate/2-oxoglutarate/acetoin dehydrogenase E1 component